MSDQFQTTRVVVGIHERGKPNDRLPVGVVIAGLNGSRRIASIWSVPQELRNADLVSYTGGSMKFELPNGSTRNYLIDYICRAELLPELAEQAKSTNPPA